LPWPALALADRTPALAGEKAEREGELGHGLEGCPGDGGVKGNILGCSLQDGKSRVMACWLPMGRGGEIFGLKRI